MLCLGQVLKTNYNEQTGLYELHSSSQTHDMICILFDIILTPGVVLKFQQNNVNYYYFISAPFRIL